VAEPISLRDYQRGLSAQLADLQTLRPASKLGILAGSRRWLVDLVDTGEVIPVPTIATVPLTRAWYAGVANVRGNLYSVIDFSAFLGGAPAVRSDNSRLLLLSDKYRVGCALLIDAVVGLRNPQLFVIATDATDNVRWVAAHYTDRDKQIWAELAVEQLIQHPDFLDIGARPA
jgi:twitching motility protein PilI